MPVDPRATAITGLMVEWRHHLHAHPETAFEEHGTASFVAARLGGMGLDVTTGLAGTGVIGTLSTGPGPVIALRADMDALPMPEANRFAHASTHA
ncbi:MAG: amidohydrolase, partial [Rhodospirillales bacterium]|nr:amidohydrolase [Rhodospirillales bacterium]